MRGGEGLEELAEVHLWEDGVGKGMRGGGGEKGDEVRRDAVWMRGSSER